MSKLKTRIIVAVAMIIVVAGVMAVLLTDPTLNPTIRLARKNPCMSEELVDFTKLRQLETALPEQDLLELYHVVLDHWSQGTPGRPVSIYLNPIVPPSGSFRKVPPSDSSFPALPQELVGSLSQCTTFAFFKDVWNGTQLSNGYDWFLTVTSPTIMSNGTILVEAHGFAAGSALGGTSSGFGTEYKLAKDLLGKYSIISTETKYISE